MSLWKQRFSHKHRLLENQNGLEVRRLGESQWRHRLAMGPWASHSTCCHLPCTLSGQLSSARCRDDLNSLQRQNGTHSTTGAWGVGVSAATARGGRGHLQAETAFWTHDSLPEHLSLEQGPVPPCSGTFVRIPLVPAPVTLAEKPLRWRSGA